MHFTSRPLLLALIVLGLTLAGPSAVHAQTALAGNISATDAKAAAAIAAANKVPVEFRGRELKVATRLIEPFVMKGDGVAYTGFSIDLWNAISAKLNLKSTYVVAPTVDDLLKQLENGQADVGIAAVSITADRDVVVDFSQPMYASGLQIAVRDDGKGGGGELATIWAILTAPTMLHLFLLMFLAAVIIAHVVWLVERRHDEYGVVGHKKYIPGIFKAFWWSMGTIGSQVDEMPRTWLGRTIALFWMFCAIVFVAYFTAAATSNITVQSLKGSIQSPNDLPGKKVATTTGSTSAAYLTNHHAVLTTVQSLDDAWKLLNDGTVDAVVFDAPVLQYYAANEGNGKVRVVGSVFRTENYGIVFPNDSKLREPVNAVLLQMEEDGSYQNLMDKYFKPADASGG